LRNQLPGKTVMCREDAYVAGSSLDAAPSAVLPGRRTARGERHRNQQTEKERERMNVLQSNRPRKFMATVALSVPLLAAGSATLFSGAASAATVNPATVNPADATAKCPCHSTPPPAVNPVPSQISTAPGGCSCTEHPTPPPTTPTPTTPATAPPTPSVSPSESIAPPAPAASGTPVATTSPSAGVVPAGGANTGGGGSVKGGSDAPLAAGGAAAAVAAGGIGFLAYRRYRKAQASA
jgi:type IV secretory pathway VirB10-like protein